MVYNLSCRLLKCLFFTLPLLSASLALGQDCPFESFDNKNIETISFAGLDHTHDYVVHRNLIHKKGTPFRCSQWLKERETLKGLELFSDVHLTIEEKESKLNLTYTFLELRQYVLFPAMKSTDLNGFMLGPGGSALNLLGHDIRVDGYARTTLAPIFNANEFMLWATSPWLGPLPLGWELLLTGVNSLNPGKIFHERSYLFELDIYQKSFFPFQFLFTADFLAMQHDENRPHFEPGQNISEPLFLSDTGWDFVPKIGAALIWDSRDPMVNTQTGHYFELRWSQFGGFLGGPANYQEYLLDYRNFIELNSDHHLQVLTLGQYRPGLMGPYDYFHVGGTNSIRSYTLNPVNYGQHEWLNTVEYRWDLFERVPMVFWDDNFYYGLQLVSGFDAALMWRNDESDPYLLSSAYVGAHLLFPFVERVRIELGIGELHEGPDRLIWGITVGFFEKSFMQRERIR